MTVRRTMICSSLALAVAAVVPASVGADLTPGFDRELIDDRNAGDCQALADLDDDGRLDPIVGGSTLTWYAPPSWVGTVLATATTEFGPDCAAADLDGDDDIDVVVPDGDELVWFENPNMADDGSGAWVRHRVPVPASSVRTLSDLAAVDVDGDGRVDLVLRGTDTELVRNDGTGWTTTVLGRRAGRGLAVVDLDGDGDPDVLTAGYWRRNDGPGAAEWTEHEIVAVDSATVAAADLDGDGRLDVVIGPSDRRGPVTWYSATDPADPAAGRWLAHPLARDSEGSLHRVALGDMDGDGVTDLVTAAGFGNVSVYHNGGLGLRWDPHVLDPDGLHDFNLGDVDGDGDLDVVGSNSFGNPPVVLFRNRAADPGRPSLSPQVTAPPTAPPPVQASGGPTPTAPDGTTPDETTPDAAGTPTVPTPSTDPDESSPDTAADDPTPPTDTTADTGATGTTPNPSGSSPAPGAPSDELSDEDGAPSEVALGSDPAVAVTALSIDTDAETNEPSRAGADTVAVLGASATRTLPGAPVSSDVDPGPPGPATSSPRGLMAALLASAGALAAGLYLGRLRRVRPGASQPASSPAGPPASP